MPSAPAHAQEPEAIHLATFKTVLARLQHEFPSLRCEIDFNCPQTDASAEFPEQEGLDFEVSVNLQWDELHLNAASFWMEWFPCTDQRVAERFFEAVRGLLSGEYRIVEHFLFREPVKAVLQRPEASRWKSIASWRNLDSLIPWPRRKRIIRNLSGSLSEPKI